MPATAPGLTSTPGRPRVVFLALRADLVPRKALWPGMAHAPKAVLWCGEPVPRATREGSWWDTSRQVGTAAIAVGIRTRSARLKSAVTARWHGIDPQWLWSLKSDRRWVRNLRTADLLVVLDTASERVVRAVPGLTGALPVLWPDDIELIRRRLTGWVNALDRLEGLIGTKDESVIRQTLTDLEPSVHLAGPVPPALRGDLPRRTEELARALPRLGAAMGARAVEAVLLPLLHAAAPQETSRLGIASCWAALATGSRVPDEEELRRVVQGGFDAADEALATGLTDLAIARAHEALGLLLHRTRHAALAVSPMADDAATFVQPFTHSQVSGLFLGLGPVGGPPPTAPRASGPTTRVLVLPGAYGAFHQDLVDAIEGVAEVRVPNLPAEVPLMRRRRPNVKDLELLAGLRRGAVDIDKAVWRGSPQLTARHRRALGALQSLWSAMGEADVVVGDWIDSGSLWATQVCPPGVRLVLRAHALDLLDPWLHLVDWRTVEEVLVTTEGMASLYRELTEEVGAPYGIVVKPHRPDLPTWRRPRTEQARFVIGMVGWGRVVKDPAWALELLERDDRRTLVLIGSGPVAEPSAGPREYMTDVVARMAGPRLRDRITVVGYTTDVVGALGRHQVGVILSSSVREGWHLGLIEGVSSGAVPVVRDWPLLASRGGARRQFPAEWVVADLDEADARITQLADPPAFRAAAERAHRELLDVYAAQPAARAYRQAVLGR